MQFFDDLMPSLNLARWAPTALRKHLLKEETETIESLCAMMMASDGEYSSLLLAERILNAFDKLDSQQQLDFFTLLYIDYDIDTDAIKNAVDDYEGRPDTENLLRVTNAAELDQSLWQKVALSSITNKSTNCVLALTAT